MALREGDVDWTYSELLGAARKAMDLFATHGVIAGDRVVIVAENGLAQVAAFFGASLLGAWPTLLNARASAREIDAIRRTPSRASSPTRPAIRPMPRRSRASSASASRRTSDRPASCWSTSFRSGPPGRSFTLIASAGAQDALYGLTEHSTVTRCDPGMPYEKRAYTDGRLQPGTEVRIVNLDGRDLGRGEQGEILTRGPELFMGYTDSRLDVDCFVDDGWFRTGDPRSPRRRRISTITDRLKDIVIRGGENISSREVEDVLVRHPQVQQVAVIGLPDERYGECVCAAVVPKEAALPTLDSLLRHCREAGLASFKTPARLVVVPALPMTASGKVRKGQLREELLARR